MKVKALLSAVCKHKTIRRITLGAIVFLTMYVVSYTILVGRGERKAKATGTNDYCLVFSDPKDENLESLVCAFYWPIYSVDTFYEDEELRPMAMISKSM